MDWLLELFLSRATDQGKELFKLSCEILSNGFSRTELCHLFQVLQNSVNAQNFCLGYEFCICRKTKGN